MERRCFDTGRDRTAGRDAPFTGRAEEVRRLRAALREGPGLTVVRGESGAGVSRLVEEALLAPEFAAWTQLRETCSEAAEAVPSGAVAPGTVAPGTVAPGAVAPGAIAGAPAAPPLLLADPVGPVGPAAPAARYPSSSCRPAEHELLRALLADAAGPPSAAYENTGTVCVLEDVHRADATTLALLRRLIGAMPAGLRLVVTEDPGPGVPVLGFRAPARLAVEEIEVGPWTGEETAEFVRWWLGTRLPEHAAQWEEAAAAVRELTRGLPAFAHHLLTAAEEVLREDGSAERPRPGSAGAPWAGEEADVPAGPLLTALREAGPAPGLRRGWERRCAALTEDARRLVEAAAVLGRPAGTGVLAATAGLVPERAEAAVEECLRRAVLRAEGPLVAVRQPLERRAALARISGPRLARLGLRGARALRRCGDGPPPLVDLARLHILGGEAVQGVRCLVVAADRAAAAGDYATATALYTRAVAEDPRAASRVRTAGRLARTAQLARAGDHVVAAVRRVLDEDDPPPRLRGEIRLHLSVVLRNQSGGALDSLNEVARAIPDLETSDPQTAARAMAVAAIPSIKGWPVERHRSWLRRGEALTGGITDPVARAAVAANRATALMLLGEPGAWAAAEELRGPATTVMEAAHHTRGWTNLAHAATALGYGARAHEFLGRAAAGLAGTSSPYLEGLTQTARLVLAWHEGRWQGLHAAADRTARLYAEIPDLTAEAMLVRGLTALHVLGDVSRARLDLTEAARVTRYDTGVILTASAAATARVHLEAGRPGQACEAVEETLNRLELTGGWVWAGEVAPTAVTALCESGQTERARRLVADFAAGLDDRDTPCGQAALALCRALLAEAGGGPADALGPYADAEARWRRLGRPFDAARAAEAHGRCLLALRGPTAADRLRDVVDVYRELGARWDVARCQRLLRRHDIVSTHRRGRLGYGDQLSPREHEVARLVVQGRSNRDIAESLVLSVRTVEHHVARVMRKLNVGSRTDIAL
ncbi:LuxR C-terminal-related transcriptional regulator [Streptomyces sp. NPDC057197]|uniref:helix-turn-helix transcriptional regulator n=1 Tax=Streptomyces sp. NPDC057197 TaxID=3346045 RepID=UPI003632DF7A